MNTKRLIKRFSEGCKDLESFHSISARKRYKLPLVTVGRSLGINFCVFSSVNKSPGCKLLCVRATERRVSLEKEKFKRVICSRCALDSSPLDSLFFCVR